MSAASATAAITATESAPARITSSIRPRVMPPIAMMGSVVAVRTSQGEIQVFHNVCRHRGARILEGAGNCPGAITCPYHGWSYKLSGELLGMTARETFPPLDRTQLALKPVRSRMTPHRSPRWRASTPSRRSSNP